MRRQLAVAAALALGGCATSQVTSGSSATEAADFTVKKTDGTLFTLSEHLGKEVVLLDFWATWCVPCAAELPHLQAMHERYKDQGLLVVGVAMDGPETVAQVGPFATAHALGFPIVLDEETRAVSLYNPHRSAPYTVVIGRDGRVASAREGYNPGDEKALEKTVQDQLAKPTAR